MGDLAHIQQLADLKLLSLLLHKANRADPSQGSLTAPHWVVDRTLKCLAKGDHYVYYFSLCFM